MDEVRRLRRLVSELELQVLRLQARCEELATAESVQQLLDAEVLSRALADVPEHAGTRSDVPEHAGALH